MKKDLCLNKRGKVVSKKMMLSGKRNFKRLSGWVNACKLARKQLRLSGFVACKKGTRYYKVTKEIYSKSKAAQTFRFCCLQEGNKVLQGYQGNLLQVESSSDFPVLLLARREQGTTRLPRKFTRSRSKYENCELTSKNVVTCSLTHTMWSLPQR